MSRAAEREEMVDALRRALADGSGGPGTVGVRSLGRGETSSLLPGERDGLAVVVPDDAALAELLPGLTVAAAVAVVDGETSTLVFTTSPVTRLQAVLASAVGVATAGLDASVRRLRAEVGVIDVLQSVGRELTAQLDIDRVVQDATDTATTVTGAAFGAFFYNLINQFGESYTLYTLSGAPREAFSRFPMPRNTEVFAPTFDGAGTMRSDDIVSDARFGRNAPYYGMPEGHLPVHSYLAVPVLSPTTGEVLGGFFFGHPETGQFTERHQSLAEGIAGYAAIALDNARLFERERNFATELSRSMLPVVPDVPGLDIVARYLPAATGIKVGGDWFDVIDLASGATAFVIGDVVGHGVTAATVMGQVRTAIRSYALLELPPTEVLRNVSQLAAGLPDPSFVTCFYAVHAPDGSLTYANAGHLPAILRHPGGRLEQIGEAMAQPLGIGREFPEQRTDFPRGADLVLYTDGLVESRTRDLTQGIDWLIEALATMTGRVTGAACDQLILQLTGGHHDDDIALLYVHHDSGGRR
ncbi:GAF domain-containing SpoIIE family protein phosphatase [Pseudonocardia sp.]|jgi:hypothetical protein|uniref:PP2C family protein-serine/threonine phosphatase n=1 Tax=Pseudonocardia sp. TaxID=60912 RepID=UPI0031FE3501